MSQLSQPPFLLALIDRWLARSGNRNGHGIEISQTGGTGITLSGFVHGLSADDQSWLAIGDRIVALEPEAAGSFTFNTKPGLKLVTAWVRSPNGAARAVARRLIQVHASAAQNKSVTDGTPSAGNPPSPRISVIVPNYNHADFLRQRLDSIYAQTLPPWEVILLDDASTDESAAILAEYQARDPGRTRLLRNTHNSGGPFTQWALGLREARGDLVWIAESDDWCEPDFLARLVPSFNDPAVMLAHGLVRFVDAEGQPIAQTHDAVFKPLPSRKWRRSHLAIAHREIQLGLGIRNTLPNASAVVFRREHDLPLLDDPEWRALRVCGDWIFYLHRLRGGKISFVREAIAHYRNHPGSTSLQSRRGDRSAAEHLVVARHLAATYRLEPGVLTSQLQLLTKQHAKHAGGDPALPGRLYKTTDFKGIASGRLPNVLIAVHAFAPGGAEGFALNLAVALHRLGCAVTVADFDGLPVDPVVRAQLPADIPVVVVNENHPRVLARLLRDFGIEWVSTHHPRCDLAFARAGALQPDKSRPSLFCTHHGYYHLDASRLFRHRALFERQVDLWINVAARGLLPFEIAGLAANGTSGNFVQLPAAIFRRSVLPVPRSKLAIPADAFVVCVASRALPEKGWRKSIDAVALARARTGRDIRLLLAGSGPVHDELYAEGVPEFVCLLGFRADVAALYATSDLGLLASTYAGESCPLGVIECLSAGKPVVVTAIGETPAMLTASDGGEAGTLVPATPTENIVEHIASAITAFASNSTHYSAAVSRAHACAPRYDIMQVAGDYLAHYHARRRTDGLPSTDKFRA